MSDLFLSAMPEIQDHFSPDARIVLLEGDCLETLKTIPSGSVRLIVSSPPYNIGKEYETETALAAYLEEMKPVLRELARVLAEDGSLCWQVGNYVSDGEIVPLDIPYYAVFQHLGFRHGL